MFIRLYFCRVNFLHLCIKVVLFQFKPKYDSLELITEQIYGIDVVFFFILFSLFCVQGLFIFTCHCVGNSEVKRLDDLK